MTEKALAEMQGKDVSKQADFKGKTLVTCLDNSGSMSGRPMESVKIGSLQLGDSLLGGERDERPFENFITLVYNTKVEEKNHKNIQDYKNYIDTVRAGNATNFVNLFHAIHRLIDGDKSMTELTVIFFTDG
jgi:hypothetical protein